MVVVGIGGFSHSITYARNSTPKVKQEHIWQTGHSYYHIKGECNRLLKHPLAAQNFPNYISSGLLIAQNSEKNASDRFLFLYE
jgi:hypothetical protein